MKIEILCNFLQSLLTIFLQYVSVICTHIYPAGDSLFHAIVQSKLFITSLIITEYSISDINLLGMDLFPLKYALYNRIFT